MFLKGNLSQCLAQQGVFAYCMCINVCPLCRDLPTVPYFSIHHLMLIKVIISLLLWVIGEHSNFIWSIYVENVKVQAENPKGYVT